MQTLRNAHLIARFVLVWFALSIGVAIASPIAKPQGIELICSGSGVMKLLQKSDEGSEVVSLHTLDCSLCATAYAPPPIVQWSADPVQPLGHVLQSIPAAEIASLTAAPPPGRGPPTIS
ncbi:MAG: DUF2946 domain-containing protein [Rhodoferax sp.]